MNDKKCNFFVKEEEYALNLFQNMTNEELKAYCNSLNYNEFEYNIIKREN